MKPCVSSLEFLLLQPSLQPNISCCLQKTASWEAGGASEIMAKNLLMYQRIFGSLGNSLDAHLQKEKSCPTSFYHYHYITKKKNCWASTSKQSCCCFEGLPFIISYQMDTAEICWRRCLVALSRGMGWQDPLLYVDGYLLYSQHCCFVWDHQTISLGSSFNY